MPSDPLPGLEPGLEPGYDVPALPGMSLEEIETPALVLDLDLAEANIALMAERAAAAGVALRPHAKSHRSAEIARMQIEAGAVGVCCQKVAEAEAMVRGGVPDVLLTNDLVDPRKMARAARLARTARLTVICDDPAMVPAWSRAAEDAGVELPMLVEIDAGSAACGIDPGAPAAALAQAVDAAPGLRFAGLQSYCGVAQHIRSPSERRAKISAAAERVRLTLDHLEREGLDCPWVTGGGTGSWEFEAAGPWTEVQCGSYVFMDADYQRDTAAPGQALGEFANALFVLTTVMSKARKGTAMCDAGLKVQTMESGPPRILLPDPGNTGLEVLGCSDEHAKIADPDDLLKLGDRLRMTPGHCDPTVNLHDWLVGLRGETVERLIRVSARGRSL
ncbi:DSD1 family PLP-dependent enzyme [Albimonas sp. CAU 1670]|uniref:DSD1 family PLP-dependent enzyme n=1 Tax=Albimonas sp. CAU 1670 TaxID=3032599 RepID=UPI0023DAA56C|nr:DSD1 family PLP-dependent enzyme [Albimonas sp. CAU 1670]MDF2234563.1 DSD1 family PLP-dependent enzyme [Albimonas sp. CAU 1670]